MGYSFDTSRFALTSEAGPSHFDKEGRNGICELPDRMMASQKNKGAAIRFSLI